MLPPQFLTPLPLSILPSRALFPRSPSLHAASLTSWSSWIWLGKEREETAGWRRAGSELPALAPSPLLPGSSHGQVPLQACSLEERLLPSLHSLLHSASTVTPLPSRPRVVFVPALAGAWTLTLLLASFHLACLSESVCSSDLSIVKSLLVCMLSGTFNGEKNP